MQQTTGTTTPQPSAEHHDHPSHGYMRSALGVCCWGPATAPGESFAEERDLPPRNPDGWAERRNQWVGRKANMGCYLLPTVV